MSEGSSISKAALSVLLARFSRRWVLDKLINENNLATTCVILFETLVLLQITVWTTFTVLPLKIANDEVNQVIMTDETINIHI